MHARKVALIVLGWGAASSCNVYAHWTAELSDLEPYLLEVEAAKAAQCQRVFERYTVVAESGSSKHWGPRGSYSGRKVGVHFTTTPNGRFQQGWLTLNHKGVSGTTWGAVELEADGLIVLSSHLSNEESIGWASLLAVSTVVDVQLDLPMELLPSLTEADKVVWHPIGGRRLELSARDKDLFDDLACFDALPSDYEVMRRAYELRKSRQAEGVE